MDIVKKIENNKNQIVEALYEWAETFDMELKRKEKKRVTPMTMFGI